MVDRLAISLAMAFGIGKSPKAPGTFGSVPGLGVGALIHLAATEVLPLGVAVFHGVIVALLVMVTLVAYWSIDRTERVLGVHDDQRIVIDEVAGQAIAAAWLPVSWVWYLLAFALFRLFDISKPGLVGKIDRDVPGTWGTLGDDLLAGVLAAALALTLLYFLKVTLV